MIIMDSVLTGFLTFTITIPLAIHDLCSYTIMEMACIPSYCVHSVV